ncbi:MAG: bifunctional DNA primase/polymerase [Planctomycetes bacterium]|nr:bifunctional DNA primase/polymerase [Planctomycetota bacterium]
MDDARSPVGEDDPSGHLLGEALPAIERGWALIPLNGKIPVLKGWQKGAPATPEDAEQWVRSGYNLGLRTGKVSGVIVVDDDSPNGSASAALNLPETATVVTGSGRLHLYFQAPADFSVRNSVKRLARDLDIRGDGGQVVFPGSIHPDTGRPYRWLPGRSPDDVGVASLPADLVDRLRRASAPEKKPRSKRNTAGPRPRRAAAVEGSAEPTAIAEGTPWHVVARFEGAIRRVRDSKVGARNDTLNRSAFELGRLVGARLLSADEVRRALHAAGTEAGLSASEVAATIESGLAAGMETPADTRPAVLLEAGAIHEAVSQAEGIVLEQDPPVLFQRETQLVRVVRIVETGVGGSVRQRLSIQEVTTTALIDKLTELIRWEKISRQTGKPYAVDCPERVANVLLSRAGAWRLPPLLGVIDRPTLRYDGGILSAEGYDPQSGLYLSLGGRAWPGIPQDPSCDDARAALAVLCEPLSGFPFRTPAHRAVAVAAILTALIRPSLRTAPLFAFLAAKMGSGKSLLADVVAMIATGRSAAVMSQGADENEDKKRMLPILAEGDPVAVIDNVDRPFGGAALCSILTQTTWRDRVLGKSQTMSLPTRNTTWIVTGNNVQFVGDITSRMLACELDPSCERPEERRFEVNLYDHIPQHRCKLVAAGLTILRAYHAAGRPSMQLPVFGRFEEWSSWVRSALVWLGLPDPCETRREVEEIDPVRLQLSALLVALERRFEDRVFQVKEALAAGDESDRDEIRSSLHEAVELVRAESGKHQSAAQCLGRFFQTVQRRLEGGLRIVRAGTRGGSATWRIERV